MLLTRKNLYGKWYISTYLSLDSPLTRAPPYNPIHMQRHLDSASVETGQNMLCRGYVRLLDASQLYFLNLSVILSVLAD